MNKVSRWEVGDGYGTYVCEDGDWVSYVDHEEVVERYELALKEINEELEKYVDESIRKGVYA